MTIYGVRSPYVFNVLNGKSSFSISLAHAWQQRHSPDLPVSPSISRGVMSAAGHFCERRLVLMVTYGDLFTFVIMLCAVVTLVIN